MANHGDSVNSTFGENQQESNAVQNAGANGEVIQSQSQTGTTTTTTTTTTAGAATTGSVTGSATGSVFGLPMSDYLFQSGVSLGAGAFDGKTLQLGLGILGLKQKDNAIVNDAGGGESSILINSDRVIINSRASHTIIAGASGVALTSPAKVNIDADESVTIFAPEGVFLGVPNKGQQPPAYPPEEIKGALGTFMKDNKKLKSYPTEDVPYEPMVLGLKLVNWLDDLLVIVKNMQILTNTGLATPREDAQWDFIAMQARLKELISDYLYIDGYSHEKMDYASIPAPPKDVTKPKTSIDINANISYQQNTLPAAPGPVTSPNVNKPGYYESNNSPIPSLKN
jgi:hypothetical protein